MNIKKTGLIASLLLSSCVAFAASSPTSTDIANKNDDGAKFAIQSGMGTGGNLSIGFVVYAPQFEIGLVGGAKVIDADTDTNSFVPVAFLGGRYFITKSTIFAYGVNFVDVFGKEDDVDIDINYTVGAYISLEQVLAPHVMLSLWVDPYAYNYKRLEGFSATKTHNFFNTGGVSLEYLF